MEDKYWWKDIVIYETYVDKFARDFKGLTEKLGYLEDLGINCIHLLPFFPSPRVDDGYDVSDYTNVQSELGTIEDAKSFISQASKHGIRVMMDLVFNHTSTQHPWFKEASSSPDSPKREYYLWSKTGEEYPEAYNPFEHLKPKSWILDPTSGQYYFSTFYPEQADLNWDNPEVEREFLNIMDFWVDAGVSLFRLDAASFLIKRDGTNCRHLPETHTVLKRIRRHIEENYPHVALLAEVHAPIEKAIEYFGDGDECHMAYNFYLMQQMYMSFARRDPSLVDKAIDKTSKIPESCQWATFLSSHDEITLSTMDSAEREEMLSFLDPESKWIFKTGKSTSMRLATVFNGDDDKTLDALRMLFEVPGSPVIYYGSEIGMENEDLSGKFRDTRMYVRGQFDWAKAEEQRKDPNSMFNKVRGMIRKRRGI